MAPPGNDRLGSEPQRRRSFASLSRRDRSRPRATAKIARRFACHEPPGSRPPEPRLGDQGVEEPMTGRSNVAKAQANGRTSSTSSVGDPSSERESRRRSIRGADFHANPEILVSCSILIRTDDGGLQRGPRPLGLSRAGKPQAGSRAKVVEREAYPLDAASTSKQSSSDSTDRPRLAASFAPARRRLRRGRPPLSQLITGHCTSAGSLGVGPWDFARPRIRRGGAKKGLPEGSPDFHFNDRAQRGRPAWPSEGAKPIQRVE
jgi:hypothetical protein